MKSAPSGTRLKHGGEIGDILGISGIHNEGSGAAAFELWRSLR